MYAAGPSQSCERPFLVEYMTLKSFWPGTRKFLSSSLVISAIHPHSFCIRSPTDLKEWSKLVMYIQTRITQEHKTRILYLKYFLNHKSCKEGLSTRNHCKNEFETICFLYESIYIPLLLHECSRTVVLQY